MADRYLLESGTPDGYLLEDGTGALVLEVDTSVSVALTGVAGTTAVGTVIPSRQIVASGVASTASAGTTGVAVSVAISGVQSTGAVGTVAVETGKSFALTGESATGGLGSVAPSVALAITGIAATGAVGTVGLGSSVALSGTQITGSVGSVTVGADLNIALSGVSSSGAVGTVTVAGQQAEQVPSGGGRYRHYSIDDDLEPEQKKPPKVKTKPQNVVVDQLVSKPSRWEKPNELINQAIIQYNQQVMEGDQADSIARGLMDEEEAICLLLLVA